MASAGVSYSASISPGSWDFGTVGVGSQSAAKTFQVTNTGTGMLTLTQPPIINGNPMGSFVGSSSCGTTLAAGASCNVTVNFSPTAVGPPIGVVFVSFNETTSFVQATLNGNGVTDNRASQTIGTISFSPTSLTVGGTTTVSATATSNLPVIFSSTTPTICSVSGSTVTGISAGTCTIAANQAGNASYSAATQVTQSITVGTAIPAPITNARVFAYAEANYPSLFAGTGTAGQYQQYNYRYYPASGNYLAVDTAGEIFLLGPYTGNVITSVGMVESFRTYITTWEASVGLVY